MVARSIRKLRILKLRISEPKINGKFPVDLGIPPLKLENLPESKPWTSRFVAYQSTSWCVSCHSKSYQIRAWCAAPGRNYGVPKTISAKCNHTWYWYSRQSWLIVPWMPSYTVAVIPAFNMNFHKNLETQDAMYAACYMFMHMPGGPTRRPSVRGSSPGTSADVHY